MPHLGTIYSAKIFITSLCIASLLVVSRYSYSDPILIFGNDQKPPKNYLMNDAPLGINIDIMQYVSQKLSQPFEYELYPWKRAYRETLEAKGGLIGMSKNNERLSVFDFSDPMYYEELLLIVIQGNEFSYTDIEDLKGKLVGYLGGASYGDDFEILKNNKDYQSQPDGSPRQRLLKLLHGRIDVAIIGPGKYALDLTLDGDRKLKSAKEKFVVLATPFKRDANYLGFVKSMQMSQFLVDFNRALKEGYDSGEIQKIIDKAR